MFSNLIVLLYFCKSNEYRLGNKINILLVYNNNENNNTYMLRLMTV